MTTDTKTFFAPQLFIKSGVTTIDFYIEGLGAKELRRWINDDGSYHVAELCIEGALFHVHEERPAKGQVEPSLRAAVTTLIGLFVEDVDAVINRAVQAGAELLSPPQDYDYDYRQGEFKDPFGHQWLIQKRI